MIILPDAAGFVPSFSHVGSPVGTVSAAARPFDPLSEGQCASCSSTHADKQARGKQLHAPCSQRYGASQSAACRLSAKNRPVCDWLQPATSSGVPCTTIRPP